MNDSAGLIVDNDTDISGITTTRRAIPAIPIQPIDAQAVIEAILMSYPEYRLAKSLNRYGYITEVVVGCVTNIFALIVTLGLIQLPICNYMAALALTDISVLLGPCLIRWLITQNIDPRNYNTPVCQLLNFQTYWSISLSAWLLVAMTVDRYIAITFPLRAIRMSTPRRARIIIAILLIVVALINIHFSKTLVIQEQIGMKQNMCVAPEKFKYFINDVWPWLDAIVHSFLPFTFLIVFNVLIIMSHRKSVVLRNSSMKECKDKAFFRSKNQVSHKLTVTLLIVAFTFIVLTAPKVILMIIRPIVFNFKSESTKIDYKILAQYTLTASFVNLLMFGNHCINFFLYVLSGQKFREQLIYVLTKCSSKRKLRRIGVAPTDVSSSDNNSTILRHRSLSMENCLPTEGQQPCRSVKQMKGELPNISQALQ